CPAHQEPVSALLRLLAQLHAEGVPVDFSPLYEGVCEESPKPRRVVTIPVGGKAFQLSSPPASRGDSARSASDGMAPPVTRVPGSNPPSPQPSPPAKLGRERDRGGDDLVQGLVAARADNENDHADYFRFNVSGTSSHVIMLD